MVRKIGSQRESKRAGPRECLDRLRSSLLPGWSPGGPSSLPSATSYSCPCLAFNSFCFSLFLPLHQTRKSQKRGRKKGERGRKVREERTQGEFKRTTPPPNLAASPLFFLHNIEERTSSLLMFPSSLPLVSSRSRAHSITLSLSHVLSFFNACSRTCSPSAVACLAVPVPCLFPSSVFFFAVHRFPFE